MDYIEMDGIYKHWKKKYMRNVIQQIFKDLPHQSKKEHIQAEIIDIVDKMESNITRYLFFKFGMNFILTIENEFYNHCYNREKNFRNRDNA